MGTRIIFRDLQRKTVACDACRSRKQKCEGLSPCSFCATKGIQCVFQEQLKRGRKKQIHAEEDSQLSTPNLVKENMLFGTAEIRNHLEFALKLDMSTAFLNYEDLISPRTTAIEVQTYAIAAVSAQTREQHGSSTVYAAKARSLVGSVFDIPDIDAVMAITFVSYYWKRNLDIRLSTHYTSVAWSLLKLVPNPDPIRSSICLHTYLVAGGEVNVDHSIIEQYAFSHLDTYRARVANMQLNPTEKAYFEIQCHCITLYAKLLSVFGHKIISPQDKETIFLPLDSIIVSEEARSRIITELVKIERCTILLGEYAGVHAIYGLVVRIHHAIVEWKSGHLMEAMVQAKLCLEIANALKEYNAIDLLSDFAHLCNLGSLVQFFCSQRCYQYAFEICEYIKYLCVKLGPSYNLLEGIVDKYVSQNIEIHLSSSTTTCTTTSTTTSTASSSSRIEYGEDADSLDISSIPSPFSISNLFNRDSNDDIESDDKRDSHYYSTIE